NASATVTIHVTPGAAGTISDSAFVSSLTDDPDSANDAASAQTTVQEPPSADLVLGDVAAPEPVLVGADLAYTLTVSNQGPDPADSVLVSDGLPASVSFGSASADQGSCSEQDGVV